MSHILFISKSQISSSDLSLLQATKDKERAKNQNLTAASGSDLTLGSDKLRKDLEKFKGDLRAFIHDFEERAKKEGKLGELKDLMRLLTSIGDGKRFVEAIKKLGAAGMDVGNLLKDEATLLEDAKNDIQASAKDHKVLIERFERLVRDLYAGLEPLLPEKDRKIFEVFEGVIVDFIKNHKDTWGDSVDAAAKRLKEIGESISGKGAANSNSPKLIESKSRDQNTGSWMDHFRKMFEGVRELVDWSDGKGDVHLLNHGFAEFMDGAIGFVGDLARHEQGKAAEGHHSKWESFFKKVSEGSEFIQKFLGVIEKDTQGHGGFGLVPEGVLCTLSGTGSYSKMHVRAIA